MQRKRPVFEDRTRPRGGRCKCAQRTERCVAWHRPESGAARPWQSTGTRGTETRDGHTCGIGRTTRHAPRTQIGEHDSDRSERRVDEVWRRVLGVRRVGQKERARARSIGGEPRPMESILGTPRDDRNGARRDCNQSHERDSRLTNGKRRDKHPQRRDAQYESTHVVGALWHFSFPKSPPRVCLLPCLSHFFFPQNKIYTA